MSLPWPLAGLTAQGFERRAALFLGEQPQEGVLGQIRGMIRAAKFFAQPGVKPAVMLGVQIGNGVGWGDRHGVLRKSGTLAWCEQA